MSSLSISVPPDPRHYGNGDHPLFKMQGQLRRRALRDAFEREGDADVGAALAAAAPSAVDYARLWCDVCDVAHHARTDEADAAMVARVFALPLIIVTGSRKPLRIAGVVPDIGAITGLFAQKGVLGKTQNFGIGNALCALETLESVTPAEVYAWTRASGAARRELVPAPLVMDAPGEEVHLRYLIGAGIAPVSEPAFVETASNVGAWGMALTRLLGSQLAQAGADVLPMARPPSDLLRASHAGRSAQLETACNLFASNAVRRFRSASGDPVAILSTHDNGELRLTLSQPFDDAMIDGFRWPLHPLDDLASIAGSMTALLDDCRVGRIEVAPRVLPERNAHGQIWFPAVREWSQLGGH